MCNSCSPVSIVYKNAPEGVIRKRVLHGCIFGYVWVYAERDFRKNNGWVRGSQVFMFLGISKQHYDWMKAILGFSQRRCSYEASVYLIVDFNYSSDCLA